MQHKGKLMKDPKKFAAITAAVIDYIKTQEEAMMMAASQMPAAAAGPAVPVNSWGISGRQSMMQMQNLMQIKAFQGSRLR